jgi:hypothetical protein
MPVSAVERDCLAKTVEHSSNDWEAWNIIHALVQANHIDNPVSFTVNAKIDILITMARAAFGQLVLSGMYNGIQTLVFRNVIILMGYMPDGRVKIEPSYLLKDVFDISQYMHQRIGGDNPARLRDK